MQEANIRRLEEVLASSGYPDRVLLCARTQGGISPWWTMVSDYAVFLRVYYWLGLSERYVVLYKASRWSGRPTGVRALMPRGQGALADYRQGTLYSKLLFVSPHEPKPIKMWIRRVFRNRVEEILAEENPGALTPGSPYQQPGPGPQGYGQQLPPGQPGGYPPPGPGQPGPEQQGYGQPGYGPRQPGPYGQPTSGASQPGPPPQPYGQQSPWQGQEPAGSRRDDPPGPPSGGPSFTPR